MIREIWPEMKRRPLILVAAVLSAVMLIAAVLVPFISDTDVSVARLDLRLEPPFWVGGDGGLMGTDQQGRDLFLRVLHGLRTSYVVGASGALIAAFIGTTVGLIAGYFGGATDAILMRIVDIQLAFPGLLLVMVIVKLLGRGTGVLAIVLGLISWMLYARVVRGVVLSLRSNELIIATASLGATTKRILLVHVLPNVSSAIVAVMALNFAALMLAEAGLSFLGFGIQPPQVSVGSILASGRDHLATSWWISTFAGLSLMLAVLTTNLLGSWLHRMSDPLKARAL